MKIVKTSIKDLILLKTNILKDKRGFFKEVQKSKILKKKFIFDCFSFSKKNILRGLHIQRNKSQAKFITVVSGEIFDVAVDLRKNSKTYGKYYSVRIGQKSNFSLYIPEGFAHGFLCLSKTCALYYKNSNYRDKNSETTIKWDDRDLKIKWPISKPILSEKDRQGISFSEFK